MSRYTGRCYVCQGEQVMIRNVDICVIGTEGLNICHPCEMDLIHHLRDISFQNSERKKQEFLAKRQLTLKPIEVIDNG